MMKMRCVGNLLVTGVLALVLPHACLAVQDVCFGTGVRPILLVPGFQGSPLYDSRRYYDIEWPDIDAFFQQYSFDEGCALAMPKEHSFSSSNSVLQAALRSLEYLKEVYCLYVSP